MRYYTADDQQRFWSKVDRRGEGECWEWQGAKRKGYGQFGWRPAWGGKWRKLQAHRVAWELEKGHLPDELDLLHSCDNTSCVNPAHTAPGCHAANMQQASERGRFPDRRGELASNSKLTQAEVEALARLYNTGQYTQSALAQQYGVSQKTVGQAVTGSTWQMVKKSTFRREVSGVAALNRTKTHCPQGHEYRGDNLQMSGSRRTCRICNNAKAARYRSRKGEW